MYIPTECNPIFTQSHKTYGVEPHFIHICFVLVPGQLYTPLATVLVGFVFPSRDDAFLEQIIVCFLGQLGGRYDIVVQAIHDHEHRNDIRGLATHPQNSSTLSKLITLLISSIHPRAAAPPGVGGNGV